MNAHRGLLALTAMNILLLVIVGQQLRPAFAQGELPVLRRRVH
jgi:hypothetical protein